MRIKLKHSPQDGVVHPDFLLVMRVLIAAAIGLACYLLWVSLSGWAGAGCAPNSSCDRVLHSRWSRWLGVPVSALALLVDAAIFAGTFRLTRAVSPAEQQAAWQWPDHDRALAGSASQVKQPTGYGQPADAAL